MDSLKDLNGWSSESISYNDYRLSDVLFDRAAPINQTITVYEAQEFYPKVGINIDEVIQYNIAECTYVINLSNLGSPYSTVTWNDVPSHCTVTQVSNSQWQISGIRSAEDWNRVKTPLIDLPTGKSGSFTMTQYISYYQQYRGFNLDGTSYISKTQKSKTWTTGLTISPPAALSVPLDFTYSPGNNQLIPNTPRIVDTSLPSSAVWYLTITPSAPSEVVALAAGGSGGQVSFNSTTKVLTITGIKTEINARLALLYITTTSGATSDFALTYSVSANTVTDTKVQLIKSSNVLFLGSIRSPVYFFEDTVTKVSGGPLITDSAYSGSGNYTLTIKGSPLNAVKKLSSFGSTISSTWNDITKTLTLVGTKAQINAHIDNITLTPEVDWGVTFSLDYSLITPTGSTATKYQAMIINGFDNEIVNLNVSRSYFANMSNYIFGTTTKEPAKYNCIGYNGAQSRGDGTCLIPNPGGNAFISIKPTNNINSTADFNFEIKFKARTSKFQDRYYLFDSRSATNTNGIACYFKWRWLGAVPWNPNDPEYTTYYQTQDHFNLVLWADGQERLISTDYYELPYEYQTLVGPEWLTVHVTRTDGFYSISGTTQTYASVTPLIITVSQGLIVGNEYTLNSQGLQGNDYKVFEHYIDYISMSLGGTVVALLNFNEGVGVSSFINDATEQSPIISTQITPQIVDKDTNNPIYTIFLNCNFGRFQLGNGTLLNNWSYTGSKGQINAVFPQIKFLPDLDVSADGYFTYQQVKAGVTQVDQQVELKGFSGLFSTQTLVFTASQYWTPTVEQASYSKFDLLLVGGGGGGAEGGGGGGGGVLEVFDQPLVAGTYFMNVGAGGVKGADSPNLGIGWNTPGGNGGDTSALGFTATGGRGGKNQVTFVGSIGTGIFDGGDTGLPGQSEYITYKGGKNQTNAYSNALGAGGAGAGGNGFSPIDDATGAGGAGGPGIFSFIGDSYFGGGGAGNGNGEFTSGGIGGGGNHTVYHQGENGTPNTGGGGAGSYIGAGFSAGNGGSGIIVVRLHD